MEIYSHRLVFQIANFFRYSFHTNVFSGPDGIPGDFGDIVTGRVCPNTRTGRFLLDRKVGSSTVARFRDAEPDRHKGTPIHHISERRNAWPNQLLPYMGHPVQ